MKNKIQYVLLSVILSLFIQNTDAKPSNLSNLLDVEVFANSSTNDGKVLQRIMNGAIGSHDMFPYMVSIQTSSFGQHLCGGTLLTPFHILTAAHCTFIKTFEKQFTSDELQVRIGPTNLRDTAEVLARVKWIKIHEEYRNKPIVNDIAVLKVDRPLTQTKSDIPPLSNSFITRRTVSGPCIAAGWGRLGLDSNFNNPSNPTMFSFNLNNETFNQSFPSFQILFQNKTFINSTDLASTSPNSSVANQSSILNDSSQVFVTRNKNRREINLRFTLLPLQDASECARDYEVTITKDILCAGMRNSRTDTCKGDSGGPLICDGKIEGIVSFGDGCDNPKHLGVYTRVYTHLKWIQKQINSGSITLFNYKLCILLFILCILHNKLL